jgi:tetratricopeptide (TPR) repeat protein
VQVGTICGAGVILRSVWPARQHRARQFVAGCAPRRRPLRFVAGGLVLAALGACLGACSSSKSTSGTTTTTSQPASFATLVGAGSDLLRSGNLNAAEQLFEQAIKAEPTNVIGYYDLGVVYQQEGERLDALREYRLALVENPKYVPAIYNRAVLYEVTNAPLAIFYYRTIISLQPDAPTAYLNLGLLQAESKATLPQALTDLAEAVKQDPSLLASIPAPLRSQLSKAKSK